MGLPKFDLERENHRLHLFRPQWVTLDKRSLMAVVLSLFGLILWFKPFLGLLDY